MPISCFVGTADAGSWPGQHDHKLHAIFVAKITVTNRTGFAYKGVCRDPARTIRTVADALDMQ